MVLDIIELLALAGLFYLVYPPSNRRRAYTSSLEHEKSNWVANERALTAKCRLLSSENERLAGKVSGLEIERESLEREATRYRDEAIESKKRLIARGIIKG